jgi:hypothetical protein
MKVTTYDHEYDGDWENKEGKGAWVYASDYDALHKLAMEMLSGIRFHRKEMADCLACDALIAKAEAIL